MFFCSTDQSLLYWKHIHSTYIHSWPFYNRHLSEQLLSYSICIFPILTFIPHNRLPHISTADTFVHAHFKQLGDITHPCFIPCSVLKQSLTVFILLHMFYLHHIPLLIQQLTFNFIFTQISLHLFQIRKWAAMEACTNLHKNFKSRSKEVLEKA